MSRNADRASSQFTGNTKPYEAFVFQPFNQMGAVTLEPDMTDLDEQLQQKVLAAQAEVDSTRRRILMTEIWQMIWSSDRLYRPSRDKISGNYEDIYHEAKSNLLEYLGRNIHKYDPDLGSVMGWVNMLLDRRFLKEAIARCHREQDRFVHSNLADLDAFDEYDPPTPTPAVSVIQLIKQCFEDDPGDKFKNDRMKRYPHVNFQAIALRHHCQNESFTDIAKDFGVPYTSLISFYQRRLKTFAPQIREYVEQHL